MIQQVTLPYILHNGANEVLRVTKLTPAEVTVQELNTTGAHEFTLTPQDVARLVALLGLQEESP